MCVLAAFLVQLTTKQRRAEANGKIGCKQIKKIFILLLNLSFIYYIIYVYVRLFVLEQKTNVINKEENYEKEKSFCSVRCNRACADNGVGSGMR